MLVHASLIVKIHYFDPNDKNDLNGIQMEEYANNSS